MGTRVDEALLHGSDPVVGWGHAGTLWRTRTIHDGFDELARIVSATAAVERPRFLGVDVQKEALAAGDLLAAGIDDPMLRDLAAGIRPAGRDAQELMATCDRIRESATSENIAALALQIELYADAYLMEPDLAGLGRRDRHMARLLREHMPQSGVVALWAHNEHVAKNPVNFGGPALGWYLDRDPGVEYVAVGVMTGPGTARVRTSSNR
ncbi:MAG: erythromycin esterase family protein, partial [Brachybacterium sp.]|nr:erythromycin esterase family protein [Brachybacterium sp.]